MSGARLEVVIDVLYAQADDGTHVAYRVLDADPSAEPARDVVMVPGGLIPLELFEEEPGFARLLDGLRALGRVIVFDRRGVGLSDPIQDWERTVVDQWTDDLAAVVDASGARDIVLVAWDGFGVGSRYAAMHPERVSALVLYEPIIVADDDWESWSERRMQRGMRQRARRGRHSRRGRTEPNRRSRRFATGTRERAAWAPARRRPRESGNRSCALDPAGRCSSSRSRSRRSCFTAATTCSHRRRVDPRRGEDPARDARRARRARPLPVRGRRRRARRGDRGVRRRRTAAPAAAAAPVGGAVHRSRRLDRASRVTR